MLRAMVYVVPVALAIFAVIDLWRSTAVERAGLHRALWLAIVVLVPVLGPVAWIVVSRLRRPARPTRRTGPPAPDDDPDFLWRIEQERRRRQQRETPPDDD